MHCTGTVWLTVLRFTNLPSKFYEKGKTMNEPENKDEFKEEQPEKVKDYDSFMVPCVPDSVTLATLNEQNQKYWNNK